ncbi:MAG: HAMP domain-containing histidine kinase [Clostridia bacterium]|nr:HAMP domain-containing histidine kinase [Clostridia bacterium]
MGFGQKIFLMSFTLIIIAINLIGINMINYTYQSNIEKEIDKNMIQINNIINELQYGINNISMLGNTYLKNNVNIEIYDEGRRIYTNFKEDYSKILEEKLFIEEDKMTNEELHDKYNEYNNDEQYETDGNITTYIEGNKLFMKMRKYTNVVVIMSDISKINNMKKEQIDYFIKLSLACSLTIAFLLSISVSFITRKIKILNKTVKEVAKGNYTAKVKKLGNDEIGNVGKSFNKMTDALQKNISEIEKVSENRKRFIGNLTHEIRTPLTSIVGYSSLIKNRKVADEKVVLEYSKRIYDEGKYIEEISQKLMDLMLLENGSIIKNTINLSEELNRIIEEMQITFPYVIFQRQIEKDVYINFDKTLLKTLIINLTKNAINAYANNPIVRIELDKRKVIKVIDYGKGIKKEELEKIKEPFYTLSKDRNRKFSGMGLGLPLCIQIVEMQEGRLEIESKENEGTKIIIKLGDKNEN